MLLGSQVFLEMDSNGIQIVLLLIHGVGQTDLGNKETIVNKRSTILGNDYNLYAVRPENVNINFSDFKESLTTAGICVVGISVVKFYFFYHSSQKLRHFFLNLSFFVRFLNNLYLELR